jgi:hypothetical protein
MLISPQFRHLNPGIVFTAFHTLSVPEKTKMLPPARSRIRERRRAAWRSAASTLG